MPRWHVFDGGFLVMNLTGCSARAQRLAGSDEILDDRADAARADTPSEQRRVESEIAPQPPKAWSGR